jgi:hypothetical protein
LNILRGCCEGFCDRRLRVKEQRSGEKCDCRTPPPKGFTQSVLLPIVWGLSAARELVSCLPSSTPGSRSEVKSAGVGNHVLDAERRKNTGKKNDKRTLSPLVTRQRLSQALNFCPAATRRDRRPPPCL